MGTNATVLVCDDIRLEMTGKVILIGIYTAEIVIPAETFLTPHLYFFFMVDTPIAERPSKITFEITMPKQDNPHRWEFPIEGGSYPPERTRFVFRQAVPLYNVVLSLGRIGARVLFDGMPVDDLAGIWISKMPTPVPNSVPGQTDATSPSDG